MANNEQANEWSDLNSLAMLCPDTPETLTRDKALLYFCQEDNPFFDKTSINYKLLLMNAPMTDLQEYQGIYYTVEEESPTAVENSPVIIRKEFREFRNCSNRVIEYYYVMRNGKVIRPTSLFDFITNRLETVLVTMRTAFMEALPNIQHCATTGNYEWVPDEASREQLKTRVALLPSAVKAALAEDHNDTTTRAAAGPQIAHFDNAINSHFSEERIKNRMALYLHGLDANHTNDTDRTADWMPKESEDDSD